MLASIRLVAMASLIVLPSSRVTTRVAVAPPGAPAVDTLRLPPAKWSRARAVDIRHVAIDLRFDWKASQAFGSTTITLAPFTNTDRITLDAAMMRIDAVKTADGTPLRHTYAGGDADDNLSIELPRPCRAGEEVTLVVQYRTQWVNRADPNNIWGSYGRGIRFQGPTSLEPKKRRQAWSMGEPGGNRYWFPSYDAPNDLRTTEFSATIDRPLVAVSNGTLLRTTENSDGTRTFHWRMDTPYANHLTAFAIGEYVDVPHEVDGVTLHSFGYPDERDAVAASIERLPDMVRFFTQLTGTRFPYDSYAQVFVQDFAGGMANAGMATITDNMIDDFRTHADYLYLWDAQEASVLAGQWFGNHLTCREWGQCWLNNAFSTYLSEMYSEAKNGHAEFLLWNHFLDQGAYLGDWSGGYRRPVVTRHYDDAERLTRDNYSSGRGAQVLHMLRKHLGEARWQQSVRRYVQANANRLVTTEDLREAVEEATGEPMEWFFDQWVYRMGHPVFEVSKSYDAAKRELTLIARQVQATDTTSAYPQAALFQGAIDIGIDDRVERIWLEPQVENRWVFHVAAAPRLVSFDREDTWIKEVTFPRTLDELLHQLRSDSDVLGRRHAMDDLFALARSDSTAPADKARILDAFRAAALDGSYWRVRLAALTQLRNILAPASMTTPATLDTATISMLRQVIRTEKAWYRAAAITFLGMTRSPAYADVYIDAMSEDSHPVINAAAIALGRSGSPTAFATLAKLMDVPSWKGENRISALNGLRALNDPRGVPLALKAFNDLTSPHWNLATSTWDHRLAGAETLVAFGQAARAYPAAIERVRRSLADDDWNDIFLGTQVIVTLGDPRGAEVFDLLKARFKDDANAMQAVLNYESQFLEATRKVASAK